MTTPDKPSFDLDAAFAAVDAKYGGRSAEQIAEQIIQGMGSAAVSGTTSPRTETPRRGGFRPSGQEPSTPPRERARVAPEEGKQLMGEARKRTLAVQRAYGGFIAEAMAKKMGPDEIKEATVSAWNTGALPPVLMGEQYRGSGYYVHILHGKVPADAFKKFAWLQMPGGDPKELRRPEENGAVTFDFDSMFHLPNKPNPSNPDAFYVESLLLPQFIGKIGPDQLTAHLARIDAAMAPPMRSQP